MAQSTTYSLKFDINEARKNLEDLKNLNTQAYQKSALELKKLNSAMEIYDKQIEEQQAKQKALAAQIKALDAARDKDGKSTKDQRAELKKLNAEYQAGQRELRKLNQERRLSSQSIRQTTKDLDAYMKSNRELIRYLKEEEAQTKKLDQAQEKQRAGVKKGEAIRNSQFNAFVRHIRQLETMVVLYYSLTRAYQSTIGIGMELNKVVEQNSYGLAALISSNTELIRNGKVVNDDQAKFAAALRMSQETMMDLKDAALETVATFPELTQIFQQAIGFALQMGDAMGSSTEQINDRTIEIAQAMSNMGGAIGMSSDRILEEIRSIFSGDVTADSKLGIILFGNPSQANQAIKESKKQVNGFYDLMSKELKEFQKLGGVDAYFINIQKLKGEYEGLWKDISEPIFKDVNRTIVQLTKDIRDNKEEFKAWGKEIYAGAKTLMSLADELLLMYGAIRGASFAQTMLESAKGSFALKRRLVELKNPLNAIKIAIAGINSVVAKNPFMAAATAVTGYVAAMEALREMQMPEYRQIASNVGPQQLSATADGVMVSRSKTEIDNLEKMVAGSRKIIKIYEQQREELVKNGAKQKEIEAKSKQIGAQEKAIAFWQEKRAKLQDIIKNGIEAQVKSNEKLVASNEKGIISLNAHLKYYEAIGDKSSQWAIKEFQLREELSKEYYDQKYMIDAIVEAKKKEFFATEKVKEVDKQRVDYLKSVSMMQSKAGRELKQFEVQKINAELAEGVITEEEAFVLYEAVYNGTKDGADEAGKKTKQNAVDAGNIIGNAVASTLSDAITTAIKEGSLDIESVLQGGLSSVGAGLTSGVIGAAVAGGAMNWGLLGAGMAATAVGSLLGGDKDKDSGPSQQEIWLEKQTAILEQIRNNTNKLNEFDLNGTALQTQLSTLGAGWTVTFLEIFEGIMFMGLEQAIRQEQLGFGEFAGLSYIGQQYVSEAGSAVTQFQEVIYAIGQASGDTSLQLQNATNALMAANIGFDGTEESYDAITDQVQSYNSTLFDLQQRMKEAVKAGDELEQLKIAREIESFTNANSDLLTGILDNYDAFQLLGEQFSETSGGLQTVSERLSVYNSSIAEQVSLFEGAASSFRSMSASAQQGIDETEAMLRSPVEATEYLRSRYEKERADARAAEAAFLEGGKFKEGITQEEVEQYNKEVGEFMSIAAQYREQIGATYASSRPELLQGIITDLEETRDMAITAEEYYRVQLEESKITNDLLRELQKSIERGNELTEEQVEALTNIESYNEAMAADATRPNSEIIAALQGEAG
jgi:hypothetical protein